MRLDLESEVSPPRELEVQVSPPVRDIFVEGRLAEVAPHLGLHEEIGHVEQPPPESRLEVEDVHVAAVDY